MARAVLVVAVLLTACGAEVVPRQSPSPGPTAKATPVADAGLGILNLPAWDEWCGALNPFEITTLSNGWRNYTCKIDQFTVSFATDPAAGDEAIVRAAGSLDVTKRISDKASAAWAAWDASLAGGQGPAIRWIQDQVTPYMTTFSGGIRNERLFTNDGTINAGVAASDLTDVGVRLITFWLEAPH